MKIIQNINNNYTIAIDRAGNQLIVSGKGVGFGKIWGKIDLAESSEIVGKELSWYFCL